MNDQTVTITLPAATYAHLRDTAARSNRSLEIVLSNVVALFSTRFPEGMETLLDSMQAFTDEQLWHVVSLRLNLPDEQRLDELTAKSKETDLTRDEVREQEDLLRQFKRLILLRSEALLLLKQRGHDMDSYLHLGE